MLFWRPILQRMCSIHPNAARSLDGPGDPKCRDRFMTSESMIALDRDVESAAQRTSRVFCRRTSAALWRSSDT